MDQDQRQAMREKVREMFYHGYNSYMKHAFPHDELKPLSAGWSDTLAELGNARLKADSSYQGVAMTLIDSLSTLAVLGDKEEFSKAVRYVSNNVTFDQDVRVNVFESNIRLLGGLLSAHLLASNPSLALMPDYDGKLLQLAEDLGLRLLKAFDDASDICYAWVNLKHGLEENETREQCTAGAGTLLLEWGLLSHLTGNHAFFKAADRAMTKLWSMKSPIGLLGNTFDVVTYEWRNTNTGIGAGIDSWYEYLLKSYIYFGNTRYLEMFLETYAAVEKYLKTGHWYVEANMHNGQHTHIQFNSLQAFWPGLQVLLGDIPKAMATQESFYSLWQRYGALPERFLLINGDVHNSERYYPLRPEFIESTYYLYAATKNPYYLEMGEHVYQSLQNHTRVAHGFASLRDVLPKQLEDRMTSFFLAETCKYLYLLFDIDNFANSGQWIFTTEGHLFPLSHAIQKEFGDGSPYSPYPGKKHKRRRNTGVSGDDLFAPVCPAPEAVERVPISPPWAIEELVSVQEAAHQQCTPLPETAVPAANAHGHLRHGDFLVTVGEGSFHLAHVNGETVDIRNLGTHTVEVLNFQGDRVSTAALSRDHGVLHYRLRAPQCEISTAHLAANSGQSELVVSAPVAKQQQHRVRREKTAFPDAPVFEAMGAYFAPTDWPLNDADPPRSHCTRCRVPDRSDTIDQDSAMPICPEDCREPAYAYLTRHRPVLASVAEFAEALYGDLILGDPVLGCEPPRDPTAVEGKIVLIQRGRCTFMEKALHLQTAGAKAIVVGNAPDQPGFFMMGEDGSGRLVHIPAVMISEEAHQKLARCLQDEEPRRAERCTRQSAGNCRTVSTPVELTRFSPPAGVLSFNPATGLPQRQAELVGTLIVEGHGDKFAVQTLGGYLLEIERKGGAYFLKIISD